MQELAGLRVGRGESLGDRLCLPAPKVHFDDAINDDPDVLFSSKQRLKAERAAKHSAQLVDRRIRYLGLSLRRQHEGDKRREALFLPTTNVRVEKSGGKGERTRATVSFHHLATCRRTLVCCVQAPRAVCLVPG
jgi:hypothetical protein